MAARRGGPAKSRRRGAPCGSRPACIRIRRRSARTGPGTRIPSSARERPRSRRVAVGEIGLDYHYDFSPRAVQREVFVEQLETARALKLPVIIHTREADDDTFAVLASEGKGLAGVFHCFTGGVDRARKALDLGFHLSLAGIVTFPKATDLHEVAAFVPERPPARRNRQPVSRPRAASRQTKRARVRLSRRRCARHDPRHVAWADRRADHAEFPRTVCTNCGYTALTPRAQLC